MPQLQQMSLKKVVCDTATMMIGQARLKNIRFSIKFAGDDIQLQIDLMRTTQILLNLISNAVKFSPENSKVEIEC